MNMPFSSSTGEAVAFINRSVVGSSLASDIKGAAPGGDGDADASATAAATVPGEIAAGIAVQSVGQSMAIAVQDATDMLRNISTVATTAVGVAMAKWIEVPEMVLYKEIIQTAQGLIAQATKDFLTIGQDAGTILAAFPQGQLPTPPKE